MTIGQRLREIRIGSGQTIATVSQECGISPASLYNWESGKQLPTISSLHKLADFYGVPADSLLNLRNKTQYKRHPSTRVEMAIEDFLDPNVVLTFNKQPLDPYIYKIVIAFLGGMLAASQVPLDTNRSNNDLYDVPNSVLFNPDNQD